MIFYEYLLIWHLLCCHITVLLLFILFTVIFHCQFIDFFPYIIQLSGYGTLSVFLSSYAEGSDSIDFFVQDLESFVI